MLEILIVNADAAEARRLADAMSGPGREVVLCRDGGEAQVLLRSRTFDIVLTEVAAPTAGVLDFLRRLQVGSPSTAVILVAGSGEVREAVRALGEGTHDCLTRPLDVDEVALRIRRIDEQRAVRRELAEAKAALAREQTDPIVLGRSPSTARLAQVIDTVARSTAPVLIRGESGTGKELIARRIHDRSRCSGGPFVAVNCAAFPGSFLEAELFGHERGAFAGAIGKRRGWFQAAEGGSLFLDEVAEMPLPAQAKLLRVLQEGAFEPLGTGAPVPVDVRVISATHRDLKERVAARSFREDLYFRLQVLSIELLPLRERREDLAVLVQHFLHRFAAPGAEPAVLSPRSWAALYEYPFPGNVRELEHALQHAVLRARSRGGQEIDLVDLPGELTAIGSSAAFGEESVQPLRLAVREFEKEYLVQALKLTAGRKAKAAQILGVSRKGLWKKLTAHGIDLTRSGQISVSAAGRTNGGRGSPEHPRAADML